MSQPPSPVRARALALYLPQFHPIRENDAWWGPGFTEWTNVAKARPRYRRHHQPNLPADLGFYDLRVPEVREAQANLARDAGIEGFVYWHYWFAGQRILERPLTEVSQSGHPDFPFCVAWANTSWTGHWYGNPRSTLIEQTYPGRDDYRAHFAALLPLLRDRRYITVDDRPLIGIFQPREVPDGRELIDTWQACARASGLPRLYIVGWDHVGGWDPRPEGYDGAIVSPFADVLALRPTDPVLLLRRRLLYWGINRPLWRHRKPLRVVPYKKAIEQLIPSPTAGFESYPVVIPNWDNTPRSGLAGSVLEGSTPALFAEHLDAGLRYLETSLPPEHRLLFVKSWNEWAEGNYLEPDARWGHAYLDAFRDVIATPSHVADQAGPGATRGERFPRGAGQS